jgi:hypothetical protein
MVARSKRLVILLGISALVLASCGGGDDTSATSSTAAASGAVVTTGAVATTEASTADTEPAVEPTTTTAAPEVDASGTGQIELVLDDGRSWTFDGTCVYTPDNSGPAEALWSIDGVAADGATFIAIMAFPFDPAKTTPVLIGNIVDADENVFVLIESEDVSDGSNLILNLGLHDSLFRTVDDPIDLTATATCAL